MPEMSAAQLQARIAEVHRDAVVFAILRNGKRVEAAPRETEKVR